MDKALKKYIQNRKLEMLEESQKLGKQRTQIQAQSQQLQQAFNQVNQKLQRLDIELEILNELEEKC